MGADEIQAAMDAAAAEVLETMCFADVLASAAGPAPADGAAGVPAVTAELHFEGDPPGWFRAGAPARLARALAAGFLGLEEPEVSDLQAGEVVCELANMICGSLLSHIPSETVFRIGHPELVMTVRWGEGASHRWFDLGEGILSVSVELERRA